MNDLFVDIESLVLDGVPMTAAQGRRLAQLTEIALARLLEQRGTAARMPSAESGREREVADLGPSTMRVPANSNEARWAEELALSLYRAVDRSFHG